jgi:hypothetical protein
MITVSLPAVIAGEQDVAHTIGLLHEEIKRDLSSLDSTDLSDLGSRVVPGLYAPHDLSVAASSAP